MKTVYEWTERADDLLQRIEQEKRRASQLPHLPLKFIEQARPGQLAPMEGDWISTWYVRGSRGSGKTWTGSGQLAKTMVESKPLPDDEPSEWGIVAPTIADTRDVCLEGPSGLIRQLGGQVEKGILIRKGDYITGYNRSMSQLYTIFGTVFGASAEDGALRVQGKNLRFCWADECGLWANWETAWDESIQYALRKPPALRIATATPKMNQKSRILIKRLLEDNDVAKSFLPLMENAEHLSENRVNELMKLRGTRLGRQEVGGELVLDREGSYFYQSQIDEDRIFEERRPRRNLIPWLLHLLEAHHGHPVGLLRCVVAVDPAVTTSEDSDETGIIVGVLGDNGHGYIVEDLSGRYSPDEWAHIVVDAYYRWQADIIVGEQNNGGDMVENTIKTVDADVPYRKIVATRGKILRAEPVSAAYAQHRVHHVGQPERFEVLESQLTDCVPGQEQEHDDHLDAAVYACTELGLAGAGITWEEVYGEEDQVKELQVPIRHRPETSVITTDVLDRIEEALGSGAPEMPDEQDEQDYDPWANVYGN